MKRSYIKLFVFEILIFIVLFLNSFISNILGEYNTVLFLLLLLLLFRFIFGFERDRHRFTKDIMFEMMIFLVLFFVVYYIFGIVIGFAKTNYLNWYGIKTFILPLSCTIILKEVLRYMMLKKADENKFLVVTTVILFIFLDVTEAIYYNGFETSYKAFIFVALSLLPAISTNIICSLISQRTGYKPLILYLMVVELYHYLLPLVPNPNEYILSIVQFLLPIFMYQRVKNFFELYEDREIERDYKKGSIGALIIPAILTVIVVYFTSGYFKFQALAIASGSMTPSINKGDIVIFEKIKDDAGIEALEKNQVLVFEHSGVVVVHRIVNIEEIKGEYYFYTKGDANNADDNYAITKDMIVGVVKFRIPFAGLPTVWLNEM